MYCLEIFNGLCFANPKVLGVPAALYYILLIILPLIYYTKSLKKRNLAISINFPISGSVWNHNKESKQPLFTFWLSWLIILVVISGLVDPQKHSGTERLEGIGVMFVVQTTESMKYINWELGENISRINIAKREINKTLNLLTEDDFVGMVEFESKINPNTACPLPFTDNNIIRDKVNNLDWKPNDFGPLGAAIYWGINLLSPLELSQKNLVVFTDNIYDGELTNIKESKKLAKENNVKIYVIDVGNETFIKTRLGLASVKTLIKKDDSPLKELAKETKGKDYKYIEDPSLKGFFGKITRDLQTTQNLKSYKDGFFIAALILLILQFYLRYGRNQIIQ